MTDPQRLSRSPAHSLTALLLRAGAEENPSAAVFNRTAEVVAAAAGVVAKSTGSAASAWGVKYVASNAPAASSAAVGTPTTAGNAALAGAKIGIGAVAKWIAIGAVGGAVAMSSVQALVTEGGTKHAQPVSTAGVLVSKPSQEASVPARNATLDAPAEPKERTNAVEAPRARSPEPLAKAETPARTESAFLAAEVRFVDQGRAAFQRAAFAEALQQLAPYEGLFPHQQLLTEVLFLRMESCSRLGDVEHARALAARVLALGVVGRQAAQAREVLGP